jgi:hypothetical protein
VLKAAGLVISCREGKLIHYRSRPDALRAILPVLDELVADEEAIRPASREI